MKQSCDRVIYCPSDISVNNIALNLTVLLELIYFIFYTNLLHALPNKIKQDMFF